MKHFLFNLTKAQSKFILLLALFALAATTSFATAVTWTGNTSTDWGTGTNWSTNTVPVSADAITIPPSPTGGRMPTISANFSITSLTIQASATLTQSGGTLTISTTSSITGTFTQTAGTVLHAGNLTVNSGGLIDQSGTGKIHMAASLGVNPTVALITIAGNGRIQQSAGNIETYDITLSTGTPVGTFTQTGGVLEVFHTTLNSGSINSTGGTIQYRGVAGTSTWAGTNQFFNLTIDATADPKFATTTAITIKGNYTNNNSSLVVPNGQAYTFNGTGDQNIYSAIAATTSTFGALTINKTSGSVILTSSAKVGANSTITQGTFDLKTFSSNVGSTFTISTNGILKLSGTTGGQTNTNFPTYSTPSFVAGSTVEYYGSVNQVIFPTTYQNLTLTNGAGSGSLQKTAATSFAVAGNLTINTGVEFIPAAAVIISGAGTLTGAGTAQVTKTGLNAFLLQYTITNKSISNLTIDYNSTGAQTLSATTYGNLSISGVRGTNNVTFPSAATVIMTGNLTTPATFTLPGTIVTTGSTVLLNGTIDQSIPTFNFNNLNVDKLTGDVVLVGNITIAGTLTFSKGKIKTGTNTVFCTAGTITIVDPVRGWVYGNLQKNISSGTPSNTFEIGGATYYTPVTLSFTGVTTTGGVTVSTTDADHPSINAAGFTAGSHIPRYWKVVNAGVVFTDYAITVRWDAAESYANLLSSKLRMGKYTSGWSMPNIPLNVATTTSVQSTGNTTFGEFVAGEVCDVTATFSYPSSPYCTSSGNATIALATGSTAGTFTSTTGLAITNNSGLVTLGTSTAGSYVVTNAVTGTAGCTVSSTASIVITAQPSAAIPYTASSFCTGGGTATVNLSGTTGGIFSSTAGLSINPSNGSITLASSTAGSYTVTYTVPAASGCSQYSTTTGVSVYTTPAVSINYPSTPYCSNFGIAPVNRTGATGGTYSAAAGLVIDATSGSINTATSTAGTYTVYSTVNSGCSATVSTSVTINAQSYGTIQYMATPYCNVDGIAAVNRVATAGGTYSSTAGLDIDPSTGTVQTGLSTPGVYRVQYSIPAIGACPSYDTATSITILALGIWKGTAPINGNSGPSAALWNNAANWQCGVVPDPGTAIVIPASYASLPSISTQVIVGNLTLEAGTTLTVTQLGNLVIEGDVTSTGGKILSQAGKVEFGGFMPQVIPANLFLGNKIKELSINNPTSVTLQGPLKVAGKIGFGFVENSTFYTGGVLTLGSDSTINGVVGDLTLGNNVSGNQIIGEVIAERFVRSKRVYRFLSAPVNCSQDLKANWMEGAANPNTSTWLNPNPGYGTHISGRNPISNALDATNTTNPSMFTYDNINQRWDSVPNSRIHLTAGMPYRIIVRGDRTTWLNSNTPPSTITTLRAKGTLVTGKVVFAKAGGGGTPGMPELCPTLNGYSFIANPYANSVSWTKLDKNDISSTMYIFDPTISGTNGKGGYVVYNALDSTNNAPLSVIDDNIQPGQGFFVKTTGPNPKITFQEYYKTGAFKYVFRNQGYNPKLNVQLLLPSQLHGDAVADGVAVVFNDHFTKGLGDEDSHKINNNDENLSVEVDGASLSIEGRETVTNADTVKLKVWNLNRGDYYFKIDMINFEPNIEAYIEDSYLNTSTRITANDTNIIKISITADPASYASNRFRVIFRTGSTLPVHFTSIKAKSLEETIKVEWNVANEVNIKNYVIEKSENGREFKVIGTVPANQLATYNIEDKTPVEGDNYYRIKSISNNSLFSYSKVAQATWKGRSHNIAITPNPVQGKVANIVLSNLPAGMYSIKVFNSINQEVFVSSLQHPGGSANKQLQLYHLPTGKYTVQVISATEKLSLPVIIN